MNISATPAAFEEIAPYRDLYRQEMNCQIVHDSYHQRGFTAMYLLRAGDEIAGYGSVGVKHSAGAIKEFYVLPRLRAAAAPLFREVINASGAALVEAQTNDRLLLLMLLDFCEPAITSGAVLFEDSVTTHLQIAGAHFRTLREDEKQRVFEHKHEPVGPWVIEADGEVAATGGFLCHYNPPYGDIYMEVHERFRNRGFGSYLVQEVKRTCYESGKRPAARCSVDNLASRATLQKAGLFPCARIVSSRIAH